MKKTTFLTLIFSFLFLSSTTYAANIYVDYRSSYCSNCSAGNDNDYDPATRDCGSGSETVYSTIQAAINAMSPGDHIILRGGTYQENNGNECINIPDTKNGTAWTEGNYSKICSYPGEWAILDGQRTTSPANRGVVLGSWGYPGNTLQYWMFERIEIKNGGRTSGDDHTAAFWGGPGPFKFRYCYIHDNLSYQGGNNPSGLWLYEIHDSIIEYNYFNNNGTTGPSDANVAHIMMKADYNHADIANNGYNGSAGTRKNILRYNFIENGDVGIKHKSGQLFSSRRTWSDTYDTYGDKIHHNIIKNPDLQGLFTEQDFCQVYNNIVDSPWVGIMVQYQPSYQMYKTVVYNNTILSPSGSAVVRYGTRLWAFETLDHYGWDYNNLIKDGGGSWPWGEQEILNVMPWSSGVDQYDLTNYYGSNNYFYSPDVSDLFRMHNVSYTAAEYEAQVLTYTHREVYTTSNGSPFVGSSGADKYRTTASFAIEGATTIADGGIGGAHPYLPGVTIPSYVGATNPDDDAWVDGVLSLTNVEILKNAGDGDPSWIEGGSPPSEVPGIPPSFEQN